MKKLYYLVLIILIIIVLFSLFKSTLFYIDNKELEINFKEINSINHSYSNKDIIKTYQNKYHNKDIIGILVIKGLKINELVVKGKDNSYYLTHLVNKDKSVLGATFMDYRSNLDSKQINIYGHNSRYYDVPFKRLERYLDQDFYKNNKHISLITKDKVLKYEIFSVNITNNEEHIKLDSNSKHIKYLKSNSLYDTGVNVSKNDHLLVLQTCIYDKKDGDLLVISAKKINNERE